MIPPVPLIPPPSFEPAALPPPVVPPGYDPESEVILPPIVAPPLSGDFEVVPGPAIVRPPSPPEPEPAPPPLLDVLGPQPAPATGPDVTIAQGWDRVRTLGQERVAAQREAASAAEELRAAAADFEAAKTPAQQQAAMKRAEAAQQRMQGAQVSAQAAGLAQEREEAAQAAEIESAFTAERTARYQEAAELLDARAADTEARVAELQAERQRAQERRAQREQEYAAMLDRGPQDQAATWTAAIGMIGEMWSAFAQRRQPNLTAWLDRGLQQAREKHAGELDALKVRIGTEEQAIEDAAVDVAQSKADDLAFEQAYLARLDRDLALLAAQYGQTPRGMAADQARRQVAAQQQARAAEASAAYEKAQREREKHAAEMRKFGAEAAIAERKAAGGGGAPRAQFGQREDIPENALVDPITGVVLGESRFDTPKDVRADQDTVNNFTTSLRDVEQYIQLLQKVGRVYKGLGESAVVDRDRARLETLYNDLFMKTQRALTGAAVTEQEAKRIARIIPGPKSYTDFGSWDPADVLRQYRDRMATAYEDFLGSRLTTGATMIRDPKGATKPTAPTYGFKASQGQAPAETAASKVIEALAREHQENPVAPYRETIVFGEMRQGKSEEEARATAARREKLRDPFRLTVQKQWRAALDAEGEERQEIIDAMRAAREALGRAGTREERLRFLDYVVGELDAGRQPDILADVEGSE